MSYELDEDISILSINEVGDDVEEDYSLSTCKQETNRVNELNALGFFRHSGINSDRNHYLAAMSRQEDLLKELQELKETNRSLQQECSSMKDYRSSVQVECLQLRDKVSSLFRENCGLKEQSAKLTIDNRALQKQVDSLRQSNTRLRDRLQQFSQQLKCFVQNKDGNASSSPVLSQQVEQVKLMLDVIGNLPKCGDECKDGAAMNEKKDFPAYDKLNQGNSLFSLELDHENLEQISHKLLEHLQQEKKELEQQYTQMVEVQKQSGNSVVATDSLQSSLNTSNTSEKDVLGLLDSCRNSTKRLKQEALIQNHLMTAMIKQMAVIGSLQKSVPELFQEMPSVPKEPISKRVSSSSTSSHETNSPCKESQKVTSASSTSNMDTLWQTYGKDIPEWETSDAGTNQCREPLEYANPGNEEDRICPMCQAVFPKSIPLPEFEAHVMEHFKSEEFEIITQDIDYGS